MTVSYSGGDFDVRDAVHTVADLVTAKGGAIATSDNVYIRTNTSPGTLRVGSAETIECNYYCGWTVSKAASSAGKIQIDGGGELIVPTAGYLQFNPYYSTLLTGTTSRGTEAEIDAQQCNNDLDLRCAWECEHLKIKDIKSGGEINLQDAYGYSKYHTSYGYSDALYSYKGLPEKGFFMRGADLGRVNTGLFTVDGEPDIDLIGDGVYLYGQKNRDRSIERIPIPGRMASRSFEGAMGTTKMKLFLRIDLDKIENVSRDIDYLVSEALRVLVVTRTHGDSGDYPVDMMFRGFILNSIQADPTGIDFRDMVLNVEGDE